VGKNVYSSGTKWAVVKDKMSGQLTNEEIMKKNGMSLVLWQLKRVFYYSLK
jgi:transposase